MSVPEPPSPFQLKVKTWTAIATGLTIVSLIIFDWDKASGHPTVFSGIRPAIKNQINRIYGVEKVSSSSSSRQTPGGGNNKNKN
jgi:hypothetical protein